MKYLDTKIKLYAAANGITNIDFKSDVKLRDEGDGNGAYIKEWNLAIAEPTAEQLASYETDGIDSWKTRIAKVKTDNPKE